MVFFFFFLYEQIERTGQGSFPIQPQECQSIFRPMPDMRKLDSATSFSFPPIQPAQLPLSCAVRKPDPAEAVTAQMRRRQYSHSSFSYSISCERRARPLPFPRIRSSKSSNGATDHIQCRLSLFFFCTKNEGHTARSQPEAKAQSRSYPSPPFPP